MGIDEAWWRQTGPLLRQAAAQHDFAISVLVHGDFKGANLCLRDGYVVAVDWSGAHVGDPSTDVLEAAIWLRMAGVRVLPPGPEMLPLLAVYGDCWSRSTSPWTGSAMPKDNGRATSSAAPPWRHWPASVN